MAIPCSVAQLYRRINSSDLQQKKGQGSMRQMYKEEREREGGGGGGGREWD